MPNPFAKLGSALSAIDFNGDVRPSQFVPVITSLDSDDIPSMRRHAGYIVDLVNAIR